MSFDSWATVAAVSAYACKSLVELSIRSALDSNLVNHTVLSTDSEEILELGIKFVFKR